jgi:hypothetical protein
MKDRKAEACRRSADEVRKLAYSSRTTPVRDALQRLAEGYDVLAEQLERIAERSPGQNEHDLAWLPSATAFNSKSTRLER